MIDDDLRELLMSDDPSPRQEFRDGFRRRLSDEWHHPTTELDRTDQSPTGHRPVWRPSWRRIRWVTAAASVAIVALVVGLVWTGGDDGPATVTDLDTVPEPTQLTIAAPTTIASVPATTLELNADLDPAGGVDGPVVYWRDQSGDEDHESAAAVGVVTFQGGCVTIGDTPVLWEFGTRWDAAAQAVIAPDGAAVGIGTSIEVGGGFHRIDQLGRFTNSGAALDLLRQCATQLGTTDAGDEVFVVQSPIVVTESPDASAVDGETTQTTTAVDWLQNMQAEGYTNAIVTPGDATDASLLSVYANDAQIGSDVPSAVLLPGGDVVALPVPTAERNPVPDGHWDLESTVLGVGNRIAVLLRDGDHVVTVHSLDPTTRQWDTGVDLSITYDGDEWPHIFWTRVGERIVVTAERWDQTATSSLFEPAFRRGALIEPDGTMVSMTLPPDGIPITTTSTAGGKMFRLGLDTAAGDEEPLAAPWAFDPATNTWTEIAAPDWMGDCEFECTWGQPHEYGDVAFEVSTSTGVARIIPDGTLGFLDAATLTWRRLDDAPFPLTYRQQVPVNDRWIVSVPFGESYDETASTDVGVLDLESGAWHRYDLLTEPLATVWESASTAAGFVFQPVIVDDQTSPWLVVNPTTGVPTIAGDDAIAAMTAQIATQDVNGSGQPIEELIAELSAAT